MELKEIQEFVFREYQKNGYLDMWTVKLYSTKQEKEQQQKINDVAELGLIVTEISEAIEIIRKKDNEDIEKLAEECSDIIIRALNFMSRKGLDATSNICHKANYNLSRGNLHGKAV